MPGKRNALSFCLLVPILSHVACLSGGSSSGVSLLFSCFLVLSVLSNRHHDRDFVNRSGAASLAPRVEVVPRCLVGVRCRQPALQSMPVAAGKAKVRTGGRPASAGLEQVFARGPSVS
jgi:hypothetical protein